MRAVKEKANAKINLYLDVVARREDGFHDIKTVMHTISLEDEVKVTYTPSSETRVRMFVKGNRYLPVDERNLAVRAALLFLKTAGKGANIDITLEKRIPVAAGLAGGSSDAAATLRAMNKLFDKMFTDKALYKMAESLGSDVPFCLYGKTALCEGRGEIITKLPNNIKLNLVVAIANERVSTPQAYTALDEKYSSFDGSIKTGGDSSYEKLSQSLRLGIVCKEGLFNVFEEAVLPNCPKARAIKERLIQLGALGALMSGSGPSVFGIFENERSAKLACEALKLENVNAYAVSSV